MAQNISSTKEEAPVQPPPIATVPKRSFKFKLGRWMISIIVLLVILLAIAVAVFYFRDTGSSENESLNLSADIQNLISDAPLFSNTLSYQVNLADGRRFLAIDIRFEVIDNDTLLYIGRRSPIVNDLIIGTLQRKTVDQLRSGTGVDKLKQDLKRRLNSGKLFNEEFIKLKQTTSPIKDIFFDKFILQ